MDRASVIVAGAGPAGVVAAYRLAQMGISVLVLEACPECPEDMRASTFHAPTLEMMSELGILEELEAQGLRAPVYQYRNRQTGEVLSFDLGEIADATAHPYRLQCEQFKLTRLLTKRIGEHPNGRVLFNHRVVHYEQDAQGVTVAVETPFAIERFRCDYLIGADGANSTVRKWMGAQFDGFTYPEKFLTLSTAYPIERSFPGLANVSYMADAHEWCVLLRVPSVWRILVPVDNGQSDAELLRDDKKNQVIGGLIGGDATHVETEHRTLYKVHQRVASRYYDGRVAIIGDAAHLNNPLGGFGMNSGVHDAWNLTQRLQSILLDGADAEAELAHFERQRRTIMREFVQAQTIKNKQEMEDKNSESQRRRQADFEAILTDSEKRRTYLLNQAMITSREREALIA
jgi:2-polyprenyl-6-methoxyphenol hydroxylase and related FAD-dependent oxidoreductases